MHGGPLRQETLVVDSEGTPIKYADRVPLSALSILKQRHYPNRMDFKKRAIQ